MLTCYSSLSLLWSSAQNPPNLQNKHTKVFSPSPMSSPISDAMSDTNSPLSMHDDNVDDRYSTDSNHGDQLRMNDHLNLQHHHHHHTGENGDNDDDDSDGQRQQQQVEATVLPREYTREELASLLSSLLFSTTTTTTAAAAAHGAATRHADNQQQQEQQQQQQQEQEPSPDTITLDLSEQMAALATSRLVPVVIIMAIIFLYNHFIGIFSIACLFSVLFALKTHVDKITSYSSSSASPASSANAPSLMETQTPTLHVVQALRIIVFASLSAVAYCLIFYNEKLWQHLIFYSSSSSSDSAAGYDFWNTMWTCVSVGCIVALAILCIKAGMAIILHKANRMLCISEKMHDKLFSIVEHVSQLYRNSLPIPIWIRYIINPEFDAFIVLLLLVVYCMMKGADGGIRLRILLHSVVSLFKSQPVRSASFYFDDLFVIWHLTNKCIIDDWEICSVE